MTLVHEVYIYIMVIRDETARDQDAVRALNEAAFESDAEARLVDALREQAELLVSLVAEQDGSVVGHILFSPVTLSGHDELKIMGLAPMAVAPSHQRRGIGTSLVHAGLDRCRALGAGAVVVLGHPEFYPRFGFVASTRFDIGSEYDVPEGVFMVTELKPGFLRGASGTIRYRIGRSGIAVSRMLPVVVDSDDARIVHAVHGTSWLIFLNIRQHL